MKEQLSIGLDLGGDTIKISFAFYQKDENDFISFLKGENQVVYGKFAGKEKLTQVAIPALAYYDRAEKKWLYGKQIGEQSESFITVVKIKSLISLLSEKGTKKVCAKNKDYYFNGKQFPKFYFPVRRKMLEDFDQMVKSERTFATDFTPQQVCEGFFAYIKDFIDKEREELNRKFNKDFGTYKIAVVHPSSVGDDYLDELSRIVKHTFGYKPFSVFSSTKALSMYAFHRQAVRNNENFLVFDMGEETITVARACFAGNEIIVDGVGGHNPPIHVGGIDVDQAIVEDLDKSVACRETIGSPSFGEEGHIAEESVYGKQYLFMKAIKKAKVIFSKTLPENSVFADGIPITLYRELYIQRKLRKTDVSKSIGIDGNKGIAKKILDYIVEEIRRPVNHDVNKVFFSGGLIETYGLLDYLKNSLANVKPKLSICTFDDFCDKGDQFKILSYEDSVFAPSVGGAIVALKNVRIRTILSLSYATWEIKDHKKCLCIFVDRGTCIDDGGTFVRKFTVGNAGVEKGEEMFSTHITSKDVDENKYTGKWNYTTSNRGLIVGEVGSKEREMVIKDIDLKTVSGGKDGTVYFKYNGEVVKIIDNYKISFEEGISVDKHGMATPIIKNVSSKFDRITVASINTGRQYQVSASDIEVLGTGLNSFKAIDKTN